MTDDIDRAQEREQIDREFALRAQRLRAQAALAPRDPAKDAVCMDCDGDIEPARLKALPLTNRCAGCARIAEGQLRGGAWTR